MLISKSIHEYHGAKQIINYVVRVELIQFIWLVWKGSL